MNAIVFIQENIAVVSIVAAISILLIVKIITSANKKKIALSKEDWIAFPLIDIKEISHDVKKFRFALQSNEHVLGKV